MAVISWLESAAECHEIEQSQRGASGFPGVAAVAGREPAPATSATKVVFASLALWDAWLAHKKRREALPKS